MIQREYENELARFESKNVQRIVVPSEYEIILRQAQELKLAKERAFKPRLDMQIDKMIRHRFHTLEVATRKEPRIALLFEYAKVTNIAELSDNQKRMLIELLKL